MKEEASGSWASHAVGTDAHRVETTLPPTADASVNPCDGPSRLSPPTHVHVVVTCCRGLRGADFTGYSDPFVELGMVGATRAHRHRTAVVHGTRNPSWNPRKERFLLPVASGVRPNDGGGDGSPLSSATDGISDHLGQGLLFSVFDRDVGRSSEFLGGAVLKLTDIPRWGEWKELTLELKRRHPKGAVPDGKPRKYNVSSHAPADLGRLCVRVAAADDLLNDMIGENATQLPLLRPEATPGYPPSPSSPHESPLAALPLPAGVAPGRFDAKRASSAALTRRHVHVCVIAGKHLVAADANGLSDPFVCVSLDNSAAAEVQRTEVVRRTINPVWGGGAGETFTLRRRPGAAEVCLEVWDRDTTRKEFLGCGAAALHALPHDGAWSEHVEVPLFPRVGGSDAEGHTGEATGFLVVRIAASCAHPRSWPPPCDPWPDLPSPPPRPPDVFVNKVASSSFVYVQVCGARGLPTQKDGEPTNVKATIALNSSTKVAHSGVQEDVLSDSMWIPEVFSFPRSPNSATVTVRVYGAMTKVWDPDAMSDIVRQFGFVSSEHAEQRAAEASPAKGLKKARFALGTLLGEVKISIADLVTDGAREPQWVPLLPAHVDTGSIRSGLDTICGCFGKSARPRWLTSQGDNLGEVCVAISTGYLGKPPDDLINPGPRAAYRPKDRPHLGTLGLQLLGVKGDAPPNSLAWLKGRHKHRRVGAGDCRWETLGDGLSAQFLFEGRTAAVASSHEYHSFEVTEPTSELRVLIYRHGPLAMDEKVLGAATLCMQTLLNAPQGEMDVWLEALPPGKYASEAEMADPNFRLRTWRRGRRGTGDWNGYVRIRARLERLQPLYRWYLRQVALPKGASYVDHTINGVLQSAERVLTAALAPLTAPLAALAHCQSGVDMRLNRAWATWHTVLCLLCRRFVLSTFLPLWLVTGVVFIGYAAHKARVASGFPPLFKGKRVTRSMRMHASPDHPSADCSSFDRFESPPSASKKLGSPQVGSSKLIDSDTDDDDVVGTPPRTHSTSHRVGGAVNLGLHVRAFEEESELEQCRLRVQRWLKEHRSLRASVIKDLQREERLRALEAQGKSTKAAIALLRRAEGVSMQGTERSGSTFGLGKRRHAPYAAANPDLDDPIRNFLGLFKGGRWQKILSTTNPAEMVIRILQQLTWTLLVLLKNTGIVFANATISLGQMTQVHHVLAGPCRSICGALDNVADSLESMGGLLSWRDPVLSRHVAYTLVAIVLACSSFLHLVVTPLWWMLDRYSPLRLWHLVWAVGVAPTWPRLSKRLMPIVVIAERALQNALGSLSISPISLASVRALEQALESEFAASGGTWEGLKERMRSEEMTRRRSAAEASDASRSLLALELEHGVGLSPARWVVHALARAPTRADFEHEMRCRQLSSPVRSEEDAGDIPEDRKRE